MRKPQDRCEVLLVFVNEMRFICEFPKPGTVSDQLVQHASLLQYVWA